MNEPPRLHSRREISRPHHSLIALPFGFPNRASERRRLGGKKMGTKGKARGGRGKAVSVLQEDDQIECGTNLNPEMTDVFSMVFY